MLSNLGSRKKLNEKQLPYLPPNLIYSSDFQQRKWFHAHGKSKHLTLSDTMMAQLRIYFNALDSHKCQYIDGQDLEDPLIVFGLCQNKEEVQKLVKQIDTDASGVIQFNQFVQIFKKAKRNKDIIAGNTKFARFTQIITGNVQKQLQNQIGIQTSISQYRRKILLNFVKKNDYQSIINGKRIAKQIAIKSQKPQLLPIIKKFN